MITVRYITIMYYAFVCVCVLYSCGAHVCWLNITTFCLLYIQSHVYIIIMITMQAREYCCLGHILSLWETISVELAKQLYLAGQVLQQPGSLCTDPHIDIFSHRNLLTQLKIHF